MNDAPAVDELTASNSVWYRVDSDAPLGDSYHIKTTGSDRIEVVTNSGETDDKRVSDLVAEWEKTAEMFGGLVVEEVENPEV